MKLIDGEQRYEPEDVRHLAKHKIMKMPKLKHKDGKFYIFDKFYEFFVAMDSEFGYKKCFTYHEVLSDMR